MNRHEITPQAMLTTRLAATTSAYRARHSTEMTVIDVHNHLVRNVDCSIHVSALVVLDLSIAFDTIDHAFLLDVLNKRFGIGGKTLK